MNKISEIPEWISELTDLEILDLSGNQIQHITEAVSKLHKLKKLNMDDNDMRLIDPSLSRLTTLEVLWLQISKSSNLESLVNQLPNLKEFYLSQLEECECGPIKLNARGINVITAGGDIVLEVPYSDSKPNKPFIHNLGGAHVML